MLTTTVRRGEQIDIRLGDRCWTAEGRVAAHHAGIRAVAVHAEDDPARAFYERVDCERSPTDPYHLLLLMNDVRAILAR